VLPKNWASTWSNQFGVLILESFASWEKYVVRDVCVKKGSELGAWDLHIVGLLEMRAVCVE